MEQENVIVDAGDALAWTEAITEETNDETIKNLKTLQQDESTNNESAQEWGETEGDDVVEVEEIKKDVSEEESTDEQDDEEEDDDDVKSDIAYVKNNPELILKLVQEFQQNEFKNKRKKKFELVTNELQELESKYKEVQKQKYADKYDDANLPVLEEKRPFWRSQNKFYSDPENESNRQTYIKRLKEEIEDIEHTGKIVSIENKETSKPDPKLMIHIIL